MTTYYFAELKDSAGNVVAARPCMVFDALTAGSQITNMESWDGVTNYGDTVTSDAQGYVRFATPDDLHRTLYVDAQDGRPRSPVTTRDINTAVADKVADVAILSSQRGQPDGIATLDEDGNLAELVPGDRLIDVPAVKVTGSLSVDQMPTLVQRPMLTPARSTDTAPKFSIDTRTVAVGETSTQASFPTLSQAPGGLLVASYNDGADNAQTFHRVGRYKTSTDFGATWSASTVCWDTPDLSTGACIEVLSTGRWLNITQINWESDATLHSTSSRYSDDGGETWTEPLIIDELKYCSAHAVELSNGDVLIALYGQSVCPIYVSHDKGETWELRTTIEQVGLALTEPMLQELEPGRLVCVFRLGDFIPRIATSDDYGVTWTTLTDIPGWTDCGSRVDWIRLTSGRILAIYRNPGGQMLMRWTEDEFASMSAGVLFASPDSRGTYSSLVEVGNGQVLLIWGDEESTAQHGRIFSKVITDGGGVTPWGFPTIAPTTVNATALQGLLLLDDFKRPTTTSGLGSANTGQRWSGHNTINVNSTIGAAECSLASGINYNVIPMAANGSIEAELYWAAASGVGVVFRYLDASNHWWVAINSTTLTLGQMLAGVSTTKGTSGATALEQGQRFNLKVVFKGTRLLALLDGHPLAAYVQVGGETTLNTNTSVGLRMPTQGSGAHRCYQFLGRSV